MYITQLSDIANAFCGVGALGIWAAMEKGCRHVVASDWNPDAMVYCIESTNRNGVDVGEQGGFRVQCGDAREFIMNLGMSTKTLNEEEKNSSSKEASVSNLPHHLILNFPSDAPLFLNALRLWPLGDKMECPPRAHV